MAAAGVLLAGWWICFVRRTALPGAVLLLAACLCLGGARHHLFRSVRTTEDIARYADEESQPVRLRGTLATPPRIHREQHDAMRSAWPRVDRSTCLLQCRQLCAENGWRPVSGRVRLSVTGHLLHAQAGDAVEVCGLLGRPSPPDNPGEFDFAEYLRRRGVRCAMYSEHPDAVRRLEPVRSHALVRWAGRLRAEGQEVLVEHLSRRTVPVASALLLGNRTQITDDLRETFAESGTMHLLAISGLHVGILALFLWFGCRLLRLSPRATSAVLVTVVIGYAVVTAGRPPVVRAAVLVTIAALGRPWYRQVTPSNVLAIALLLILAWNPGSLFDIGAQLSFLAVAGIIWSGTWPSAEDRIGSPVQHLIRFHETNPLRKGIRFLADWLKRGYVAMAAIWLCTAPLVAARFHLISPVGLVINVFLIPVVALILAAGFGLLLSGLLLPPAAPLFGSLFDTGLSFLLAVTNYAAGLDLGHMYVAGPPTWWLIGYYGILAGMMVWDRFPRLPVAPPANRLGVGESGRGRDSKNCRAADRLPFSPSPHLSISSSGRLSGTEAKGGSALRGPLRHKGAIVLLGWIVLGLAVGLMPPQRDGLRCTFLSLGHGSAVIVECPNGRTLLYDAGSLADGYRARQTIEAALWKRGISRIDAVVVSHPDIDHFNAVPGLLRDLPVGSLLMSRSFLDFGQDAVARLCEAAAAEDVPIEFLGRGDRLQLDDAVSVDVLHPPAGKRAEEDNANSVVLLIAFRDRRILLPGDLDGEGLEALLERPPHDVDVLLAPHHGSRSANRPELAGWARPELVAVSAGRRLSPATLAEVYDNRTRILPTVEHGAVTVRIDDAGRLRTECFHSPPDENSVRTAQK